MDVEFAKQDVVLKKAKLNPKCTGDEDNLIRCRESWLGMEIPDDCSTGSSGSNRLYVGVVRQKFSLTNWTSKVDPNLIYFIGNDIYAKAIKVCREMQEPTATFIRGEDINPIRNLLDVMKVEQIWQTEGTILDVSSGKNQSYLISSGSKTPPMFPFICKVNTTEHQYYLPDCQQHMAPTINTTLRF